MLSIVRVEDEFRVSGQLKIPRDLHGTSWVLRIVRVNVEYRVSCQLKIPTYDTQYPLSLSSTTITWRKNV
jgi:hypothetical protein